MNEAMSRRTFLGLCKGTAAALAPYLVFTMAGCSARTSDNATSGDDASAQTDAAGDEGQQDGGQKEEQEDETPQVAGVSPQSLSDYSWDEIAQIAAAISAAESDEKGYKIAQAYNIADPYDMNGGKRTVTLADGSTIDAWVAGFRHDDKADGTGKAGITFLTSVTPFQTDSSTSKGRTWEKSEIRKYLSDTVLSKKLPQDLVSKIVPVSKISLGKFGSTDPATCVTTTDSVWLPSLMEIMGAARSLLSSDYEKYEPMVEAEGSQYTLFYDPNDETIARDDIDSNSTSFVDDETGLRRYEVSFRVMSRENAFLKALTGSHDGFWTRTLAPNDGGSTVAFCKPDGETQKDFYYIYPWAKLNMMLGFCL